MDVNIEKIMAIFITGGYGVAGSITHYLYEVVKNDKAEFKTGIFFLNGFFGFFMGNLAGSFMPPSFQYRDGVLMLCGFLVYQIFSVLEQKGIDILIKRFQGK